MKRFIAFVAALAALLSACSGGNDSSPPPASPRLSAFAGSVSGRGSIDGTGTDAQFNQPYGVATDAAGNVYVADTYNFTVRKISTSGAVTTLAGMPGAEGSADGTGATARFGILFGIAVDSQGNVFVTDTGNHTVRRITAQGVVTTLAGTAGAYGEADGTGAAARFLSPQGIAIDAAGNVYVSDVWSHTIRKIDPSGVVTTLAGNSSNVGYADGMGAAASFNYPAGLVLDSAGDLLVADSNNQAIRKVTPAGVVTTIAGPGYGHTDGPVATATFSGLMGLAFDAAGNLYVADSYNDAIRKITPGGIVSTIAGAGVSGNHNGPGAAATFFQPWGIAATADGTVYVADSINHAIRRISNTGDVSTLAGNAGEWGNQDGPIATAQFSQPAGIAVGPQGDLYVADVNNHSARRISPQGAVSTLAAGGFSFPPTTELTLPWGIASDGAGNVYVADSYNHAIRKISPNGVLATLAGTPGTSGTADGTSAAAGFFQPRGLAVAPNGDVYVADTFNHAIRKITPAGVVTTIAGASGVMGYGDGPSALAGFTYPHGLAIDAQGNVFVADTYNNTVRKITPAGNVSTLAGGLRLTGSRDDVGTAARFNSPSGIVVDAGGNVYVSDTNNHTIRKIASDGSVTTVAGVAGRAGFAAGPLPGLLAFPVGLAWGAGRTLYITQNNGIAVIHDLP